LDRKGFAAALLSWWRKNKRQFPWRKTKNPYHILVSEIMLHRTRANQVVSVYQKFIKTFPTIRDVAVAPDNRVKEILGPLGLNWRNQLFCDMARIISQNHNGQVPYDTRALRSLPGVSNYIASAVRCFAFGIPEVLLDTNIVRVIGRVFGEMISESSRRSRRMLELARSVFDDRHPRDFNYALIDLAASICKPRKPLCRVCPVRTMCEYALNPNVAGSQIDRSIGRNVNRLQNS
jgi:A/G-specific adenine glycosylase